MISLKGVKLPDDNVIGRKTLMKRFELFDFADNSILMLIEDKKLIDKLERWLITAGIRVRTVADNEVALEELYLKKPDMIIVENHLSEKSHHIFVQNLKSLQMFKNIPVVLLTDSILPFDEEDPRNKWFCSMLESPPILDDIIRVLAEFIGVLYDGLEDITEDDNCRTRSFTSLEVTEEFRSLLTVRLMAMWDEISGAVEITEVSDFALKLLAVAQKHNAEWLEEYAKALLRYVNDFDIKNLELLISQFPGMILEVISGINELKVRL